MIKNNVKDVPSEDGTTSTTTSFVKATTCPASFCHTSYTFSLVVSWFQIDKDALHRQARANLSILITPKTSSALFKKSKVQHTNVNCCHISPSLPWNKKTMKLFDHTLLTHNIRS